MTTQSLRKIAEGREAEMFAWEDGRILRLLRDPDAQTRNQWQAAAMESAGRRGVRVPAVYDMVTVDGRPGMVMERIDGTDLLTAIGRQPLKVFTVGRICGEVHARMHAVEAPATLPPLKANMERAIDGAKNVLGEDLHRFALEALAALPDGDRLCHGDFHPANIMMSADEPVVIDWTGASRGHPDADLTRSELILRIGDPPPGTSPVLRMMALSGRRLLMWLYLRAYRRVRPVDIATLRRWRVPVAAARISDGIEVERPKLIALLRKARGEAG